MSIARSIQIFSTSPLHCQGNVREGDSLAYGGESQPEGGAANLNNPQKASNLFYIKDIKNLLQWRSPEVRRSCQCNMRMESQRILMDGVTVPLDRQPGNLLPMPCDAASPISGRGTKRYCETTFALLHAPWRSGTSGLRRPQRRGLGLPFEQHGITSAAPYRSPHALLHPARGRLRFAAHRRVQRRWRFRSEK